MSREISEARNQQKVNLKILLYKTNIPTSELYEYVSPIILYFKDAPY